MTESKKTIIATNFSTSNRFANQQEGNNVISSSYQYRQTSGGLRQPQNVNYTSSKIITTQYDGNQGGSGSRMISQKRVMGGQSEAIRSSLEWADQNQVVITGDTDFSTLKHTKQLLLSLLNQFNGKNKVIFQGDFKEDYSKRLLLLQHELQGTMRRVLSVSQSDPSGGKRSLDYAKLLNDKENMLNDKQRKISNYQQRLKSAEEKIIRLELEVQNLNNIINQRNDQIKQIRRLLQVKSSALDKLKSNPNAVRDVLAEVSKYEGDNGSISSSISSYISQLEREITKLKSKESNLKDLDFNIESWILGLPAQSVMREKLQQGQRRINEDQQFRILIEKFGVAAQLYKKQIEKIRVENPGVRLDFSTQILDILKSPNTRVSNINGFIEVQKQVRVTTEVPVQDSRTKSLIHALVTHVRSLHDKYPKLKGEMDGRLQQFLTHEMADIIQFDMIDRIVDIVRYVPQVVKVENVYTYSSDKNRKTEFHLRVLIKALLQEMEKVKKEKGIVFEIDEGVIGMIRAEIMDLVNIDDILKVYRAVPRIVQVPYVVEKVVDNIIKIPEKYQTNQVYQSAIALQKPHMAVDQKALIVQSEKPVTFYKQKPVQIISHTQKVVSHPQMNERVAIEVRQKTKLQPTEAIIQKIVEKEVPVYIEKEKIIIQEKINPVEIIKEVVRYVETVKQVPRPVEVIVEKIVTEVIEKEKIVLVPQIIEKIVQVIRYETINQEVPVIETRIQIVKQIVQKIVPVIHVEEKIVQVPQIIEKIVTVEKIIQKPPKQIQIIRDVLRVQQNFQIIQVEVPKIIYETKIEIREIQKFIQVPMIVPQIKIQKQIHQVPFIETVESVQHVPVEVIKHVVLKQQVPVEVIKNVPFIMKEEVPIMVKEQKIVTQDLYYEKIKEVPTTKEKIIQKIVEVPKCVQIEKIVEKIVVVPRIVEKIVLVPQIIEKIVQKIIQIPIQMPPVQTRVPYQVVIDRPIEVERQKIVYITNDKQVHIPGEQILVKDLQTRTNVQVGEVIKQRVVVESKEVPVQIHVDKIITVPVEKKEIQIIEKVIFKPIEVPVPVTLEKTVPVYINTETVHVQQVPNIVQKIVQKTIVKRQPQIINQIQQQTVVEQKYKFKEIPRIVIQKQIQQVERFQEKIVAINTNIDRIVEIPTYIQKLIPIIQEIPKIYEYEKEPKVIFTPPSIEIVDRIVPKIINVNKYFEKIVQKLVEVPHLLREVQIVKQNHQRNIQGPEKTNTVLKTVNMEVEKELIRQKQKILQTKVSFIEESLKAVTQIIQKERDPVIITQDRIVEVPHVLEKIVEKVTVMPQVYEVLKYVHQIIENEENGVLNVDISVEAQQYKKIGEDLQKGFGQFIIEMNKVKSLQPSAAQRISMLEQYLAKFRRFIKYPRIHEIIKQKVVEKDKIVKIPAQKSASEVKEELAKVLLIEKLIAQISRIKRTHPQISLELEDDINFIFRLGFDGKVRDINSKLTSQLKQFEGSLDRKFAKMGGWSKDHQLMLKSFLQERFILANIVKSSNQEIKNSKRQNQELVTDNLRMRNIIEEIMGALVENKNIMPGVLSSLSKEKDGSLSLAYSLLVKRFDEVINRYNSYEREDFQPTRYLGHKFIEDMLSSHMREKEKEIEILKGRLISRVGSDHSQCNVIIEGQQNQINSLKSRINDFSVNSSSANGRNVRTLELEIEKLNRQLRESSMTKSNDSTNLKSEISRLNLIIQQGNNHNQCNSIKQSLQLQNNRQKREIESLIIKLQNLEKQLFILQQRQRDIQSPKRTMITNNSNSPRDEGKRSIVISHVQRASEDYGQNFHEYVNNEDLNNVGTLEYQGYRSGIMEGRDLTGSSATYRSGQVITSSQYIKGGISGNSNAIESARYLDANEGTQISTSTAGISGVKKYNYYQKRYEGN